MRRLAVFVGFFLSAGVTLGSDSPAAVGERLVGLFISADPFDYRPTGYASRSYTYPDGKIRYPVVCEWLAALDCAQAIGRQDLVRKLVARFEPFFGSDAFRLPTRYHVDFSVFGALPLGIYLTNGDRRCLELGLRYADRQWAEPPKEDGETEGDLFPYEQKLNLWKRGYSPQTRLWIDDMFMITVLQVAAYRATGERKYIERAVRELVLYLDELQGEDGLFCHAKDVPFVWGRGDGWVAVGMTQLLQHAPADVPGRNRVLEGFRKMMKALLAARRPDGLWAQLVGDPQAWPETSASGMFAFAFAVGEQEGWLGPCYGDAARKAYRSLLSYLDEHGNVREVCAGTSRRNDRAYYLARPRGVGDPHGQAALLWLTSALSGPGLSGSHDDRGAYAATLLNRPAADYRGLWYFNEPSHDEYVYKYSGGLGTYCEGHVPMAVYDPAARKTFFCWGGTDKRNSTLLHCVSYYDHASGRLAAHPTVVLDKHTCDCHDNPSLALDDDGYLYLFAASHGRRRAAYVLRSAKPHDSSTFEKVWEGNFSYPQPFYVKGKGIAFIHAHYAKGGHYKGRTVQFATFPKGARQMSARRTLAAIGMGDYPRSWLGSGGKIGLAFDRHPEMSKPEMSWLEPERRQTAGLNWRTDLYYMESDDFGETWRTADGKVLDLPLTNAVNPALVAKYSKKGSDWRNVYIKGVKFDPEGHPIVLYVLSRGYRTGPSAGPREWWTASFDGNAWCLRDTGIRSDSNYDFGELYVESAADWRLLGATERGPQPYNPGGEIVSWRSRDAGRHWMRERVLTKDSPRNHNYCRRPLDGQPDFLAFWADGHGRKPSESRLWWCGDDLVPHQMPFDETRCNDQNHKERCFDE